MKRPIFAPAELPPFFRNLLVWGGCYCVLWNAKRHAKLCQFGKSTPQSVEAGKH